jgi:predicted phosphodiesterase
VVTLGDHLSGPLQAGRTARYLMARRDWIQLAGNHERYLLNPDRSRMGLSDAHARGQLDDAALAWIGSLSSCLQLDDDVMLCHGTPLHDDHYLLETIDERGLRPATHAEIEARLGLVTARVLACGHSHLARAIDHRGLLLVNPGSVGLPAYQDDEPFVHRVENDSPAARYAILESNQDEWTCEMLSVDYDHLSMADLAEANGRPDWASALATGRMPS